MADVLLLIVICATDSMKKFFLLLFRGSWLFCKVVFLAGFVPLFDGAMLLLAFTLFLLCKLFKQDTPKITRGKYCMVYPIWEGAAK